VLLLAYGGTAWLHALNTSRATTQQRWELGRLSAELLSGRHVVAVSGASRSRGFVGDDGPPATGTSSDFRGQHQA